MVNVFKGMSFRGMLLKNKIILLSMALILFICGTFSVFYVRYVSQLLEDNTVKNTKTLSYQISTYYDEQIRSIISSVFTLTSGDSYNSALSNYFTGEYSYPVTLTVINNMIDDMKMSNQYIGSVYVYTPEGDFYDLTRVPDGQFDFLRSKLYAEYAAAGSPNFFEGHRQTDEVFQEKHVVIPFIVKTPIAGYPGDVYFIVNINSDMMEQYIGTSAIHSNNILVVNSKRQVIASNDHSTENELLGLLTARKDGFTWNTSRYFISCNRMETNDWFVFAFSNRGETMRIARYSVYFVLLLIVAACLVAGVSSIFLSNRIVRPLEDLQKSMVRVTKGQFDIRYEYAYKNEVGRLADCFNFMVERIGTLVLKLNSTIDQLRLEKENVRQEQSLKRAAELNALQAQINPHFLYNTLNSIVWLAAEKNEDEIAHLASELSKFYEYRIHRGKNIIPIRDELEQVKSYLAIQKVRYGNRLAFAFETDDEVMEKLTVKMVLQPLVENAIFHGIQCKEGANSIIVRIQWADAGHGDILLEVEDDGIGIPPEQLDDINRRLDACENVPISGYGIYNVNERIKLYFDSQYGLHYTSEYQQWTKAAIHIPQTDKPLPQSAG